MRVAAAFLCDIPTDVSELVAASHTQEASFCCYIYCCTSQVSTEPSTLAKQHASPGKAGITTCLCNQGDTYQNQFLFDHTIPQC